MLNFYCYIQYNKSVNDVLTINAVTKAANILYNYAQRFCQLQ